MVSVWFLNLDADDELAKPTGFKRAADYEERRIELIENLAALTSREGGTILEAWNDDGQPTIGRAWMPTPKAIARLTAAGVTPAPAPHLTVLKRANSRKFSAALGVDLPGAAYTDSADELDEFVARPCVGTDWLLKRPFSFAGKGRQRVSPGILKDSARTWALASLRDGEGIEIQPHVRRVADFALHGYVPRKGNAKDAATIGAATRQVCDPRGQWTASELATAEELSELERERLHTAATETAVALRGIGYFGPFGIDAMRWRDTTGALHFCPRLEVNARYTMGWAVGMQTAPDLLPM
jgi:hypothetical protein